jgi:hypothetical protein
MRHKPRAASFELWATEYVKRAESRRRQLATVRYGTGPQASQTRLLTQACHENAKLFMKFRNGGGEYLAAKTTPTPDVVDDYDDHYAAQPQIPPLKIFIMYFGLQDTKPPPCPLHLTK